MLKNKIAQKKICRKAFVKIKEKKQMANDV